jgi:O-antigen ligase
VNRLPDFKQLTAGYTAIMIGGGALIGTGISVVLALGIIGNLIDLLRRRLRLALDRPVVLASIPFVAFFLAEAVAALVNFAGTASLVEILENVPFLAFPLLFASMARADRPSVLAGVEAGVLAGAFACGAWALAEVFLLGHERASAMARNAGVFGLVSAVLYGFALAFALAPGRPRRTLAVVAAAAAALALLLSGMRVLMPVLVLAPAVALLFLRPRAAPGARVLLAALVLGAVGVALLWLFLENRVLAAFADLQAIAERGDYDNSIGLRLVMWQGALDLIAQRPFFGYGPGSTSGLTVAVLAENDIARQFSHFHNFVLQFWVRSGVFAVLAALLTLVAPLWFAREGIDDTISRIGAVMLAVVALSYLLSGATGILFGHDILDALFVFASVTGLYLVLGDREAAGPAPA